MAVVYNPLWGLLWFIIFFYNYPLTLFDVRLGMANQVFTHGGRLSGYNVRKYRDRITYVECLTFFSNAIPSIGAA